MQSSPLMTPDNQMRARQTGMYDYVSLCFDDIVWELDPAGPSYGYPVEARLFDSLDAAVINTFLAGISRTDILPHTLVVQCDAGISRSAAVGIYAARCYLPDDADAIQTAHPHYNPRVLSVLEENSPTKWSPYHVSPTQ